MIILVVLVVIEMYLAQDCLFVSLQACAVWLQRCCHVTGVTVGSPWWYQQNKQMCQIYQIVTEICNSIILPISNKTFVRTLLCIWHTSSCMEPGVWYWAHKHRSFSKLLSILCGTKIAFLLVSLSKTILQYISWLRFKPWLSQHDSLILLAMSAHTIVYKWQFTTLSPKLYHSSQCELLGTRCKGWSWGLL